MEKQINIFGPSGCLNREAMLAFLESSLPAGEMTLARQHLHSCELCRDALEGLSMIAPERRRKELEKVTLLFDKKINTRKVFSRRMAVSMAAALLVLLIGFYGIFKYKEVHQPIIISQQLNKATEPPAIVKEDETSKSVPAEDPAVSPKASRRPTVVQAKKEIPTPQVQNEVAESASVSEIQVPAEAAPAKEEEVVADKVESVRTFAARSSEISSNRSMNAEKSSSGYVSKPLAVERKMKTESVYYSVDQNASFQNGDINAFKKYVEEKLNAELNEKVNGSVTITFMVDSQGAVKDAFVVKGLNATVDSMALQIVKNSPKWKPAKQGGKEVNQGLAVVLGVDRM